MINTAQTIIDDYDWKAERTLTQSQLRICFEHNTKTRLFYLKDGNVALRIHFKDSSYLTHLL